MKGDRMATHRMSQNTVILARARNCRTFSEPRFFLIWSLLCTVKSSGLKKDPFLQAVFVSD
jgi:hypothetical protein